MTEPYILEGSQIIDRARRVVIADVHGLATPAGRERAATMLAALNADPARKSTLNKLLAKARAYSASATATDDDVKGVAYILTQLIEEIAR